MRLFHTLLLLAIAVLAIPNSVMAQAVKFMQVEKLPLVNVSFTNPCNGEEVVVNGSQLFKLKLSLDATGAFHAHLTITNQHVTGIGVPTGTLYNVVGGFRQIQRSDVFVDEFPFVFTFVDSFKFISPGSEDNFVNHRVIHWTIFNLDGDASANFDKTIPECVRG